MIRIIGVVSSPRHGFKGSLYDIIKSKDINDTIYNIGYEGKVSNSEALLLAALHGAHQEGAEVQLIYPGDELPQKWDGVVMSTPVYFGDRSSSLHNFISTVQLKNKAAGIVSSGAKRNGGQETTNIYALYDSLDKGALITGNGPPTAQYGGTGWAGNKTAIVNDDFGIKTSWGTGRQVARLAKMIDVPPDDVKANILIMKFTRDCGHDYFDECSAYFPPKTHVRRIYIPDKKIKPCVGCPVCPNGDLSKEYKCIMKDDMKEVRQAMIWADAIIFQVGRNYSWFQNFIERTRFIRRNHFDLGERVYSCMSINAPFTDITPIRIMTNMLRQNMFGLPFYRELKDNRNIHRLDYVHNIVLYARKSKTMRRISGIDHEYTNVGYDDAKLDEKAYRD